MALIRRCIAIVLIVAAAFTMVPALTAGSAQASTLAGSGAGYSPGWKILWESDAELARDLDAMAATGATWLRVDFDWPSIQPDPGSWNWGATDRVVREATRRGMRVLALPTYTPRWQRPAGTTDKHAPNDPAAYGRFVAAAAQRYAPLGVKHWEIWNEANIVNFWQPLPDAVAYTRLLRAAATAIRAVDPGATVLTSGTAPAADTADGRYIHPTTFLRTIYQQGGGASFDAVSHHPYSFPVNPLYRHRENAFWGVTPALREIMLTNGDQAKKIWGTEFGAPTGTSSQAVTEQKQADHLVEAYTAWDSWDWTGPLFWYNWRNAGTDLADREDNFGLVTEDFRAKPALAAMTGLFGGSAAPVAAPAPTTTAAPPPTTVATTTTVPPTTTTTAPDPKTNRGQLKRLAGPDRFATAALVSADETTRYGGTVFVVTGSGFADALASGAPAALEDAPILLTEHDAVPEPTRNELQRLRPRHIVVMGGLSQVSKAIEEELGRTTGATVERVAGADRYGTAIAATRRFFRPGVAALYLADGRSFPDALATGAIAGGQGTPLLLVGEGGITDALRDEILRLRPTSIVVTGGEHAVPEKVSNVVAAITGANVRRVFGIDRFGTAAELSQGSHAGPTYIAAGRSYADALSAAPAAAVLSGSVLLVEPDHVPDATRKALERLDPSSVVIVGGTATVSQQVETELAAVLHLP